MHSIWELCVSIHKVIEVTQYSGRALVYLRDEHGAQPSFSERIIDRTGAQLWSIDCTMISSVGLAHCGVSLDCGTNSYVLTPVTSNSAATSLGLGNVQCLHIFIIVEQAGPRSAVARAPES